MNKEDPLDRYRAGGLAVSKIPGHMSKIAKKGHAKRKRLLRELSKKKGF